MFTSNDLVANLYYAQSKSAVDLQDRLMKAGFACRLSPITGALIAEIDGHQRRFTFPRR